MANKAGAPKRHSIDSLKNKLLVEVGNEYSILSDRYVSYGDKNLVFKHNTCGTVYTTSANNFFLGSRCGVCKQKENGLRMQRLKKSKFDLEWAKKLVSVRGNGGYELLATEYSNVHTKVEIKHLECGTIFKPTLNNFRQGTRCPECTTTSRGERHTEDALREMGFDFVKQHVMKGLKHKRSLKLDFYIPLYNVAVEYDGEQHGRRDSKFFSSENIIRDLKKDSFCQANGIMLIRIPHTVRTKKAIVDFITDHILK